MRIFLVIYLFVVIATVSILGFRGSISKKPPLEVFPDMDRQAKYKPQAENEFSPTAVTIALFLLARLRVVTILTMRKFSPKTSRTNTSVTQSTIMVKMRMVLSRKNFL